MDKNILNNLCIIPARGGSKRIPRKNIRPFLGKPIIAYSIEAALSSGLFTDVIVSTDDEEIAAVARQYGASVPFLRSAKNADDHATLADVVNEVLTQFPDQYQYACCLLSTAPLVTAQQLQSAYDTMISKGFKTVRPVVQFSYPIQRALQMNTDGTVDWFYPEYAKTRSQDLPAAYHDAGQFYWMHANEGLAPDNRGAIIIPDTHAQDIDSEEDWKLAEMKFKILNK